VLQKIYCYKTLIDCRNLTEGIPWKSGWAWWRYTFWEKPYKWWVFLFFSYPKWVWWGNPIFYVTLLKGLFFLFGALLDVRHHLMFIVSTTHFFHQLPCNKKGMCHDRVVEKIPQKKSKTRLLWKKKNRVEAFCGNDEGLIQFEAVKVLDLSTSIVVCRKPPGPFVSYLSANPPMIINTHTWKKGRRRRNAISVFDIRKKDKKYIAVSSARQTVFLLCIPFSFLLFPLENFLLLL
jgi:hypothetical protein